jgi:hypothetical protein
MEPPVYAGDQNALIGWGPEQERLGELENLSVGPSFRGRETIVFL